MQLDRPPHRLGQRGFTVYEVLVATSLSLAALATFNSFNRFQLFTLQNQARQLDVQTTARSVVDLFAREVRRAGLDPTCQKNVSAIFSAKSQELRIQSDLNGNGLVDGTDEDITYRYNLGNNSIERVANGSQDVLVSGLSPAGSRIRYYDAAGGELKAGETQQALTATQRAAVRRIRIELALAGGALGGQGSLLVAQVSTDVDLRNRFFVGGTACP